MKIALCDDNEIALNLLSEKISPYFKSFMNVEFSKFSTPESLLECMDSHKFSFFFLDIDMPNINGIELAKLILEKRPTAIIIFVTSYKRFAFDAFQCDAVGYLLKTADEEAIKSTVDKAIKKYNSLQKSIILDYELETVTLPIKDILYVEYVNRRCHFYTDTKVYTIKKPLKNIISELENYDFCQIHQYLIVNFSKIIEIRKTSILLCNNKCLDLSRYRRNDVMHKYIEYRKGVLV